MSWPTARLDELCDIQIGRTPARADKRFWDGGTHPWASIADISRDRNLTTTKECITDQALSATKIRVVPAGTVLMSFKLSIGKVAIARIDTCTNEAIASLSVEDPETLDRDYLARALESLNFDNAGDRAAKGKTLNKKSLAKLEIPLPPLDEQKRIAAILDQADELRRKRQRAIDRLNQLGQSIFHEMFGDPVVPSNRLASRLIDIAELINGDRSSNYPSGNDIKDDGILFLNTTNIRDGELDFTKAQFITEAKFGSLSRGKLQRGDLVITLRGTLGQCALFECQYETGFINAQMMIIRAKKTVLPRFLREYISFPSVQAKLKGANSGSAVPQLTATQMKEMQILLPALDDQRRFVEAIDTARSVQKEFVAHLNRLDGLFTSLQHRAFQGEL